jgi:hypothetical protein
VLHCAGGLGSTLVISGATTSVTLKHCQFLCCSTAILSGASVVLEDCHFKGSIDSLAMLASSHETHVALSSCTFTSWDEAVVVDGGAAVEMHGGCQVSRICWSGVSARGAGSHLSMTDVELLHVGSGAYGQEVGVDIPAAVAAFNGAQLQLKKCTVANNNACAGLRTCTGPDIFNSIGLCAMDKGTNVEASDSEFRECYTGVYAHRQASVHLFKCKVARNENTNVITCKGAVVGLTGCTILDSLKSSGLSARGKGTCVNASISAFQGNFLNGLAAWEQASVQLDKCMVARNMDDNVFAHKGAVIGLTGCTVADSLKQHGLAARDKGTRVDAKETTFIGNFLQGVAVWMHARVQLDKCTVKSNTDINVVATDGAVVRLTGSRIALSLKKSGLAARDKGTRVDAKETTFEGNFIHGVAVSKDARVQLDNCTAASNTDANVIATEGAVVSLTGCRIARSLRNSGLVARDKGTRVDAKETTFERNFMHGMAAWEHASVRVDKHTMASIEMQNMLYR